MAETVFVLGAGFSSPAAIPCWLRISGESDRDSNGMPTADPENFWRSLRMGKEKGTDLFSEGAKREQAIFRCL